MNTHLCVVNNDTFGIHIQSGFLGFVMAPKTIKRRGGVIMPNNAYYGQVSDLMNVRKGDLIFFYLMYSSRKNLWPKNKFNPGYYGIYRVKSSPFLDKRNVKGKDQFGKQLIFGNDKSVVYKRAIRQEKEALILPIRILIEPMKGLNYAKSVNDNTAYVDKTDEGQLWTLLFKKIRKRGQARGATPILPEEARKVARLLFKTNQIQLSEKVSLLGNIKMYGYPHKLGKILDIDLKPAPNDPGSVWVENMLVAWIMKNIDRSIPVLKDLVGKKEDLEFHANHIQYGIAGDTVDILLLHRRKIKGIEYRYKATVIEVKKDRIKESDVDQALNYTKWIAQLVTFNNISAIQPAVIGKAPSKRQIKKIKAKIQDLNKVGIRTPIFLEYKLHGKRISFSKITF